MRERFRAKYGCSPDFAVKQEGKSYSAYNEVPTALKLFLYREDGQYCLPVDLQERLKAFVPEPEGVALKSLETLENDALTVRHTEREAILDLSVLLRLVDQGKIQVSDKTSLPSTSTLNLLAQRLEGGDYYVAKPKQRRWDQEIGPIKAFGWPLLLRAGGLMQRNGARMGLSPAGLKVLSAPPASALRALWNKWLKANLLDEFSRIDVIKGQRAKGRVMSALGPRRAAIADALCECPLGAWVDVDDFSRFMLASGRAFEVTHDAWKLYIADPQYGSLGYDGFGTWDTLQLRYLLCFLFEYAAPLGLIDLAYTEPAGARNDFGNLWGVDEFQFLSRYDGLRAFRLTPLGAYCLGLTSDYTPASIQSTARLSVLPSLRIELTGGALGSEERLLLDTWAEESDDGWRLDKQKALAAVERGQDVAELSRFLQSRDDQPLPEPVDAFISTVRTNGRALKSAGTALLLECRDAETAEAIATHKEAARLCVRAGERHLVVRIEHEDKFRALVRILGFGVAS